MVSASAKRLASSYTPRGPIGLTLPQYSSFCGWTSGSPYTSEVEASRKRAFFSLARPSALCVPSDPTFNVGIGSSWWTTELVPFGHDEERIGVLQRLVVHTVIGHAVAEVLSRLAECLGVVHGDDRAAREETLDDCQ